VIDNDRVPANGAAEATHLAGDDHTMSVNSQDFIDQLNEVRKLKKFLFDEKVNATEEQYKSFDLGALNNITYRAEGRLPNLNEWREVDEKFSALISCLDINLRRKLRVRELDFYFGRLPLALLFLGAASTTAYMVYNKILDPNSTSSVVCFVLLLIIWTITQGALGACAFLGTSVISTRTVEVVDPKNAKEKPTVGDEIDITDPSVLKIRVLSGSLFAFLIGLPLAERALSAITDSLFDDPTKASVDVPKLSLVFAPFIIGFSTNFVLAVMNRVIASLQIMLGITSRLQ
jgi:hypothetical protein